MSHYNFRKRRDQDNNKDVPPALEHMPPRKKPKRYTKPQQNKQNVRGKKQLRSLENHDSISLESAPLSFNLYLSEIDWRNQYLVFGYIRYYASTTNNLYIFPPSLINYIILYSFMIIENWSECTVTDELEIKDGIITLNAVGRQRNWVNVFAAKSVESMTGIHEWIIKVTAPNDGLSRWVLFGIVPSDIVDNFDEEKNNKEEQQWISNNYIGGHALHLGTGNCLCNGYHPMEIRRAISYITELEYNERNEGIVKMILDSNNGTLRYRFNKDTYQDAMNGLKFDKKYKMAVSLLCHPCKVQSVSYHNIRCGRN